MRVVKSNITKDGHELRLCEKIMTDGSKVYDLEVVDCTKDEDLIMSVSCYDQADAKKRYSKLFDALKA